MSTTPCHHCIRGQALKAYALAAADCPGCAARVIAKGHWFVWSRQAATRLPAYQLLLERAGLTHEEVCRAAGIEAAAASEGPA